MIDLKNLSKKDMVLWIIGFFIANQLMKSLNSQRRSKTTMYYKQTEFNKKIIEKCTSFGRAFIPPLGMTSALIQTFISTFLRKRTQVKSEIEHLGMDDDREGISLSKVIVQNPLKDEKYKNVIIFILPGLTGEISNPYINSMVSGFLEKGFSQIYVYNYRLLSDRLKITKENINLVDDLQYTFQYLKKKFPDSKIYGIGHSYGANQIVNYLGTFRDKALVEGAVSLANPYNMQVCCDCIKGTIWDYLIAKILSSKLKSVRQVFEKALHLKPFDVQSAINSKRVIQFDEALTIKIYHYNTAEEYYKDYSSSQRLPYVTKPLLGISAEDDPVAHHQAIPIKLFEQNPNCILLVTSHGGHVGWVQSPSPFQFTHWQVEPTVEFIQSLI